jgi:hypothetical protein
LYVKLAHRLFSGEFFHAFFDVETVKLQSLFFFRTLCAVIAQFAAACVDRVRYGTAEQRGVGDRMAFGRIRLFTGDRIDVRFKWADNTVGPKGDGNVLDFYRHGDAAPDGRFLYRYFE